MEKITVGPSPVRESNVFGLLGCQSRQQGRGWHSGLQGEGHGAAWLEPRAAEQPVKEVC